MAKTKKHKKVHHADDDNVKAVKIVISFLILSLAVGLYFFYSINAQDILNSGKYYFYLFAAVLALGLLLGLTYLVHQPHHPHGKKK